mmetsp:Transcript_23522/g.43719  ORF Transcript_23522/g.43719 Transcript_23522/m.43719 type:complete len:115 (-) Transcript_23522:392-736(-)
MPNLITVDCLWLIYSSGEQNRSGVSFNFHDLFPVSRCCSLFHHSVACDKSVVHIFSFSQQVSRDEKRLLLEILPLHHTLASIESVASANEVAIVYNTSIVLHFVVVHPSFFVLE